MGRRYHRLELIGARFAFDDELDRTHSFALLRTG
jgi:hypothetical protein